MSRARKPLRLHLVACLVALTGCALDLLQFYGRAALKGTLPHTSPATGRHVCNGGRRRGR